MFPQHRQPQCSDQIKLHFKYLNINVMPMSIVCHSHTEHVYIFFSSPILTTTFKLNSNVTNVKKKRKLHKFGQEDLTIKSDLC